MSKRRRLTKTIVIIATVLVSARLVAPYLIANVVNKAIAGSPNITGGVDDIDLWLLSGRVSFKGLTISKADSAIPAPIFKANSFAFSVSWKDLFRGRLYGDIELNQPELNVVDGKTPRNTQTGAEIDWRRAITGFYPFQINRIYVDGGEVHFRNFESEPPVDLYLEAIDAEALNITNQLSVEEADNAKITATATTIGNGEVNFDAEFNLIKEPAKARLIASLKQLNLTALNDFAKAYANLDVQAGVFELDVNLNLIESSEIAELDGELTPVATDVSIFRWRDDVEIQEDPGLIIAWEGLADAAKWLLEAGPKDRLETTLPIEGSVERPEIGVGRALWGLVKNAFTGWLADDKDESE